MIRFAILALSVAVAVFAYFEWLKPAPELEGAASTAVPVENRIAEPDKPSREVPAAHPQSASQRQTDPEIALALGGGKRDEKCNMVTRYITDQETGRQIEALECVYETEQPHHPYDDYSSETLAGMTYADPFAALVLAKRLHESDPQETWQLVTRAAALLQDGEPLSWLAAVSYSHTATNEVADVQSIETYYVLASMANSFSETPLSPAIRNRAQHVHVLSDEDIVRLDEIVRQELQIMSEIRSQVTGT